MNRFLKHRPPRPFLFVTAGITHFPVLPEEEGHLPGRPVVFFFPIRFIVPTLERRGRARAASATLPFSRSSIHQR